MIRAQRRVHALAWILVPLVVLTIIGWAVFAGPRSPDAPPPQESALVGSQAAGAIGGGA